MPDKLLWKILIAKLTATDPPPKFVEYILATEAEAVARINPDGRLQANLVGYDELRHYYADKKLAAYAQLEGRIEAMLSRPGTVSKTAMGTAVGDTRRAIEAIRTEETETVIANLTHTPQGLVLLSESRPNPARSETCHLCGQPCEPEDKGIHTGCAQAENAAADRE